jgi:AcrR family transcriptional regulator
MTSSVGEVPAARPRRLRREEAKARTRALLLQAAAEVFARKGFGGASVDDVAEAAGFSIGALYSNFTGKQDVLLALVEDHVAEHLADIGRLLAETQGVGERRRALGRYLTRVADEQRDWCLLSTELWLYAVRHPPVLERLAAGWRALRGTIARLIEATQPPSGERHAAPPTEIATVVLALFDGLITQRLADPDAVPEHLFGDALAWLFHGLTAAAEEPAKPPTGKEAR